MRQGSSTLTGELISDNTIDVLIKDAIFSTDSSVQEMSRKSIREIASARGIFPASIHSLYEAAGRGFYNGMTVPAINIRGITYHVARTVFRAALKGRVGAFIFEIARSEISYTKQRPEEYVTCILAAAIREGFEGPVFIQGDHFQVNRARYNSEPETELKALEELIREAVSSGFLNIDIDASTLVDLDRPGYDEQQEENCLVTAELTKLIRSIEPEGVTISIGGEIGEISQGNSTVEDLRAFVTGYRHFLPPDVIGISKVSVQAGTAHGGTVLSDGSIAKVRLDFKTLEELSGVARAEFSLGGAVQHGASTLPDEAFDKFPQAGTLEIHLATGFQNIIYQSPYFPGELLADIEGYLVHKYGSDKKPGETYEQFLYKTRKKAFGDFKREMWNLPEENLGGIMDTLEDRFSLIFQKLNVTESTDLVSRLVTNVLASSINH